MSSDGYSQAIDYAYMQRCQEKCQAQDTEHPVDTDRLVRQSVCPCMAGEDRICNALSHSLSEAGTRAGMWR